MAHVRTMGRAMVAIMAAAAMVATSSAAADAATHHGRGRVTFHVSKHGAVRAPQTVRPGRAHVHSTGNSPIVFLVKSKHHHTAARLIHDMKSGKRFMSDFTYVGLIHDGYVLLTRGTYFVIGPVSRPTLAKVATMHVRGKTQNAKVPSAATYRVDSHRKLHAPSSQSRQRWVHFVNNSSSLQELALIEIGNDTSTADINKFIAHPTDDNLDNLDVLDFADGGIIGPHQQWWSNAHLHSHRYVATLFGLSSSDDLAFGDPHLVTVH